MLHDNIEGVVIKMIDQYQVEIEDTFGFNFPVLRADLIVVDAQEDQYFSKGEPEALGQAKPQIVSEIKSSVSKKGVFLALVEEHSNFGLYVINGSSVKQFMSVNVLKNSTYKNLFFELVSSQQSSRIGVYALSDLETWTSFLCVYHPKSDDGLKPSLHEKVVKFKVSKIRSSQQEIPMLKKKGYLIGLDSDPIAFDEKDLQGSLEHNQAKSTSQNTKSLDLPPKEVDLHLEALGIDEGLENHEILAAQLRVFREKIEAAIAHNFHEITFIHGLGNGKLRTEIHRLMKEYPSVKYFEDAQKSRFGYGATKVVF